MKYALWCRVSYSRPRPTFNLSRYDLVLPKYLFIRNKTSRRKPHIATTTSPLLPIDVMKIQFSKLLLSHFVISSRLPRRHWLGFNIPFLRKKPSVFNFTFSFLLTACVSFSFSWSYMVLTFNSVFAVIFPISKPKVSQSNIPIFSSEKKVDWVLN